MKIWQSSPRSPLLRCNTLPLRRTSFLTEYFQEKQYARVPTWQAVRTEQWKYIHYVGLDGMDELYDIKADPYEMKNLIKASQAKPAMGKMKSELDRLEKEFQ